MTSFEHLELMESGLGLDSELVASCEDNTVLKKHHGFKNVVLGLAWDRIEVRQTYCTQKGPSNSALPHRFQQR